MTVFLIQAAVFASETPCASNPCQNGGSCINIGNKVLKVTRENIGAGGYRCDCLSSYTGTWCENSELRLDLKVLQNCSCFS